MGDPVYEILLDMELESDEQSDVESEGVDVFVRLSTCDA